MNLTRERVRQLEMRGLSKLRVIADDEPRTQAQIDADEADE
jgi:DNA-directed RNA polymerase sigma subunit (sigma70/sigma32)